MRQYLRNGYMSWDGSFFVEPASASEVAKADPKLTTGHAMTALLSYGPGAVVIGFLRHDRYQSRMRFRFGEALALAAAHGDIVEIDIETLIDRVPHESEIRSEPLALFGGAEVEPSLRRWARMVAENSPLPPRLPKQRLTGWCSWYNLYASLGEPVLLEHMDAAARFPRRHGGTFRHLPCRRRLHP